MFYLLSIFVSFALGFIGALSLEGHKHLLEGKEEWWAKILGEESITALGIFLLAGLLLAILIKLTNWLLAKIGGVFSTIGGGIGFNRRLREENQRLNEKMGEKNRMIESLLSRLGDDGDQLEFEP